MTALEWLFWHVYWIAGLYVDVVVILSPFWIYRLITRRWPWPLGRGVGPMRPNDGMVWADVPARRAGDAHATEDPTPTPAPTRGEWLWMGGLSLGLMLVVGVIAAWGY